MTDGVAQTYMRRWFLSREKLERAAGLSAKELCVLLMEGAAPGVIYSWHMEKGWWSALAAYLGRADPTPPEGGTDWYSPGAVWWLRRARLMQHEGMSSAEAAENNRNTFARGFLKYLPLEPHAPRAYAECFANEEMVEAAAEAVAQREWDAWARGAYAVCLRFFSAESCIAKEALAKRIADHFEYSGDPSHMLSPQDQFDLAERLAALMLPFAPWEREAGTPGRTIDRFVRDYDLGEERPFD